MPGTSIDIYVAAKWGNDNYSGIAPHMAVRTLSKALSLVPPGNFTRCHIHLFGGEYLEPSKINFFLPKPVGLDAIDFAIVGEMASLFGDRICTVNDPSKLIYTDSSLAVAVNAYVGATLYSVGGVNKDESRTIVSNTASAFTINKPWEQPPAKGDVFQVQQPAVVIKHTGITFWGPGPVVGLQHLKFESVNAGAGFAGSFLVRFSAESVEMAMNGATFTIIHYCGIIAGTETATLFPSSSFSTIRQAEW